MTFLLLLLHPHHKWKTIITRPPMSIYIHVHTSFFEGFETRGTTAYLHLLSPLLHSFFFQHKRCRWYIQSAAVWNIWQPFFSFEPKKTQVIFFCFLEENPGVKESNGGPCYFLSPPSLVRLICVMRREACRKKSGPLIITTFFTSSGVCGFWKGGLKSSRVNWRKISPHTFFILLFRWPFSNTLNDWFVHGTSRITRRGSQEEKPLALSPLLIHFQS